MTFALWSIAHENGWSMVERSTGSSFNVRVSEIAQGGIENYVDGLKRRSHDLSVIHFPFWQDVRIAEAVEQLLAKRFEFRSGGFTVHYRQSLQCGLGNLFEGKEAAGQFLLARHSRFSSRAWARLGEPGYRFRNARTKRAA
jgi:hypothetical protein